MPWDRTQPTAAKYRDREYQRTRKRLMAVLKRDGSGVCAELVCVMPSRYITADMQLHLCHTADGLDIRGLGHALCNVTDAAKRGRRRQTHVKPRSACW
jgi:hypothetical protein